VNGKLTNAPSTKQHKPNKNAKTSRARKKSNEEQAKGKSGKLRFKHIEKVAAVSRLLCLWRKGIGGGGGEGWVSRKKGSDGRQRQTQRAEDKDDWTQ
jgi:hypothetical protein